MVRSQIIQDIPNMWELVPDNPKILFIQGNFLANKPTGKYILNLFLEEAKINFDVEKMIVDFGISTEFTFINNPECYVDVWPRVIRLEHNHNSGVWECLFEIRFDIFETALLFSHTLKVRTMK